MESTTYWTKKKGQELFEQALAFEAEGKTAEAVDAYQKSLVECPRNGQAHYNLGIALATTGNIGQALRSWQRAIWLDPGFKLELIKAFDIADELAEEVIGDEEELWAKAA
ncbi:MAG: tetratricopeptide repeat protein [Candidatus Riflebacteria bacterium]|jgi:tetratricopeptide (TPR) repeat protein|nr:tetratricopeptide repeat protein [Candidatus Riflebacteria bacterium]